METVFPTDPGYAGFFLVGFRKVLNPATATIETQRTGTVILKRTYDINPSATNPPTGSILPSASPLPVFIQDQPEGLLHNGDFEADLFDGEGNPVDWQPAVGVTIAQIVDPADEENHLLQVMGSANGEVIQTITFPKQVARREFTFSFAAKADQATAITGARLQADGNVICDISRPLTTELQNFSQTAIWPVGVTTHEVQVVLRMAGDTARTIFYDNIAVQSIVYEHDLAPFKPEGDIFILISSTPDPISVMVDTEEWLRSLTLPPNDLNVFGWEVRGQNPRKAEGAFPDDKNAYPLPGPLPDDFDNLYYNGYRRNARAAALSQLPYLPATAAIVVERDGGDIYSFILNGETITAHYEYYSGLGLDKESRWQKRTIEINLDTLVIEPDENRCYVIWRGVWNFDDQTEDSYRRLVVEATA